MEDVSLALVPLLTMLALAIDWLLPPTRTFKRLGVALLITAGVVLMTGLRLPISRQDFSTLSLAIVILYAVLAVMIMPKLIRDIKAAARE